MSRLAFRQVATHLIRDESRIPRPTDAQLLAQFAATHDEGAFAELVARHGGLVRGTARRCVRDAHVAEDVYQAAFLVLASKAGAIRWGATVGPWLHATTVRLARKALRRTAPVPTAPVEVSAPVADPVAALAWAECCRALDEELAALPEVLRGPLVLCYLQGRTRDEAAHALGCSLAMLKRRLERGRNLLRARLTRRGVALPAAGIGLLACELGVSAATIAETTRTAVAFAARGTASPGAAALVEVARAGFHLKAVVLAAVTSALVACGVAFASFARPAEDKPGVPNDPPAAAPKAEEKAADGPGDPLPAGAIARLGTLRLRPGGHVDRVAFSPDGAQLASWSSDSHIGVLTIWDTKTGRALRRVELPGAHLGLLVWLADGRGIALVRGHDEPAPLIWEFTDEKADKPQVKPPPRADGGGSIAIDANQPVVDNEHDGCYAIRPDGKVLVIGKAGQLASDREVQLWELKTGARVNALKPLKGGVIHPGNCNDVRFTPDGKTLVAITHARYLGGTKHEPDQLVTVWDAATGKQKAKFKTPRPATNGARMAVALSNTTLAIGLEKGDTSLWELTTGKERQLATGHDSKKPGHGYGTYSAAFLPDGKALATGGRDNAIKLWDVASGKLLHTLAGHHSWVEMLVAAPGGKLLASSGQDGLIRLWNPATGTDACPLPGHKYTVWNVALARDSKLAVTAGWDNTVRWWDATTGAELRSITVRGGLMGMTLSPDGKAVLAATDDGKLRVWDSETGRETTPANLPADAKFEVFAFTPDGKHMVAAAGPKVTVWEWPALKLARTFESLKLGTRSVPNPPEGGENRCQVVAVSPDGKWVVTVAERYWFKESDGLRYGYCSDGVVDVFEFATGKRVRRLAEAKGTFRTGTFTADGRFVLIGGGGTIIRPDGNEGESFEGELNLLDPVAGKHVRSFEPPPAPEGVSHRYSGASALAPDGRTLYVSYNTGDIVAYEVATGRPRRTLTGHKGYVGGLALSADGKRLISGGHDSTALVWDVTLSGAAPRANPLTEAEAEKLWEAIGRDDAKAAFAALTALAGSPDRAVDVVRRHLKPAPAAPTDAVLNRIFTDLGSEDFATREKASKQLEGYGESAVTGVRKRLEGELTAEARQRAGAFLKPFDKSTLTPARCRQLRAVELLEGLGTPASRKLLTELARGGSGAPLTLDASAALKRLGNP